MIISNLEKFEHKIEVIFPEQGEIRKILKEIITKIESKQDDIILLQAVCVGRRILNNQPLEKIIELIDHRRFRIYLATKKNDKIHIQFGWHKIKKLNNAEKSFIINNWKIDFFDNLGRYLIIKSGGVLFTDGLIYRLS
jgi:hypothetical protein